MKHRAVVALVVIVTLLFFFLAPVEPSRFGGSYWCSTTSEYCAAPLLYHSFSCQVIPIGVSYDSGYGFALGYVPGIF